MTLSMQYGWMLAVSPGQQQSWHDECWCSSNGELWFISKSQTLI